jgi:hypothetical protein
MHKCKPPDWGWPLTSIRCWFTSQQWVCVVCEEKWLYGLWIFKDASCNHQWGKRSWCSWLHDIHFEHGVFIVKTDD